MKSAAYRIVPFEDGWGVAHDGKTTGPYETKEAAFEAAVLPASNAIKLGYAVSVMVEGSEQREPALGAR
jgi:LDH2 family malate/lactate/ureidoglycolate dehydrogenase